MIYEFRCRNEKCKNEEVFIAPISEGPPSEVICKKCGDKMSQIFGSSIQIPDYMRATAEGDQFTSIKHRMQKSRPSGRDRIYY